MNKVGDPTYPTTKCSAAAPLFSALAVFLEMSSDDAVAIALQ
jgi:hypothetical protein